MRVGVIGAGFVGLTAALRLTQKGHEVVVLEKEDAPGGLAIGFRDKNWKWPLERHYHHLFTSDWAIRKLAQEVGHKIIFVWPKTSTFYKGGICQLDSPQSLLLFPHFNFLDKIRVSLTLLYLRLTPYWKPLENVTAYKFLKVTMGNNPWKVLWEPLFAKKFGKYSVDISASWFWARIKKRSVSLGYPEKGFASLADSIAKVAHRNGAQFKYGRAVVSIKKRVGGLLVITDKGEAFNFDRVVCTLPTPLFFKIAKDLPRSYKKKYSGLLGLGTVNLVLALKKPFFKDSTYWLNVNDLNFPFLAVVEHSNFMNKAKYGGDCLVYVGNYLETTHEYFQKSAQELFREFAPYLKRISPHFSKKDIRRFWVFRAPFAQPVVGRNYSRKIPPIKTPVPGLYLANIQQVYPWDRGTNYAVELGTRVAELVHARKV